MKFEMKGTKGFQKQLENIEKQAKGAVEGKITLSDLLTNEFISKHSKLKSAEEFINNSPFAGKEVSSLEDMNTEEMNDYVIEQTDFETWIELYQAAAKNYGVEMLKKAGFKAN